MTEKDPIIGADVGSGDKDTYVRGHVENGVLHITGIEHTQETKADWLRSEIEKLEGMKKASGFAGFYTTGKPVESKDVAEIAYGMEKRGYNQALTSIITRYKEELLELDGNGI